MNRDIIESAAVFLLTPKGDFDKKPFAGRNQLPILQIHQKPLGFLLRYFVPDKVLKMQHLFVTVFKCQLYDSYITVPSALALDQKPVLRRESASQDIIYLTRNAFKELREIFSAK